MWVRSEYAGEFAVLSAWLCGLLPWAVTVGRGEGFWLFRIHFVYLFFQFVPGIDLGAGYVPWVLVHEAPTFPDGGPVAFGYRLWVLSAALFALPLALSVAYYVLDERLEERSPVDPVRVMGGLLVVAAVPLTGTVYLLATELAGYTVPVGLLFMYVLGGLLLTVERTETPATDAADAPASGASGADREDPPSADAEGDAEERRHLADADR